MTKENVIVELDEVLAKLGPFGKYTIYNYALIVIPSFLSGLIGPAYNFEAMDINYRCKVPECETINNTLWLEYAIPKEKDVFSKCKAYLYYNESAVNCSMESFNMAVVQECDTYIYSDQDSIVKDFNLGCQNWKRTLVGSVHHFGYFVALPLSGFISDKYGRTIAMSITSFMCATFGIARSFSVNYNMMMILEFLETALGAGYYSSAFVMGMEFVGPRGRAFGNNLMCFYHVLGIVIITALAWWLQNWRYLLRIIFLPALIPVSYFLILKETPRWLITKGRHQEAIDILRNAAKMNKVEIPENMLNSLYCVNDTTERKIKANESSGEIFVEKEKKVGLFWQVIKSKIIVTRLILCSYLWISGTFIYYGLSINSVSLSGNKYLNFMMTALVEIPANFILYLLLDKLGRKRIISFTFLLSGCMCISLSLLPKDDTNWILILYLFGKFFGTMAYSSMYIYVSEVFPTNVRQSLFNFCSTMGRVGTTLAPLTPLLALHYKNLPAIFFGAVALSASILTFILPETVNVALPNTIEEAENMSNRN